MRLSKRRIDVGIFTNNAAALMEIYQQRISLPFGEMVPLGGGVRQQRQAMNGSVLKISGARDPLADEGDAGYRELIIARDGVTAPETLSDPDGNTVTLVPCGDEGVEGIGLRLAVRGLELAERF